MNLVQYNECSVSSVDTNGRVFQHQGISSYSAEYAPIIFQSFMGYEEFQRICFTTAPWYCTMNNLCYHIEAVTKWPPFSTPHFQIIFLNENVLISIQISLTFVPKGQINNIPALVQIMAWRRPGDKPLSEPMMVSLLTHIYITRPWWIISMYDTMEFHHDILLHYRRNISQAKQRW